MIHGTAGHHLSRGWWHHGKGKASRRSKRPVLMWKCDENVMKVTLTLPWQHYLILKKKVTSVRRIIERGIAGIVTVEAPWFLDYFVVWALAIPQSRYLQQGTQYSTQNSLLFGTGRSSMIQGFLGEGITCQPWMSGITWDIAGLLHLQSPARHSTGGGSSTLVGNVDDSLFCIFQARPLCPFNISFWGSRNSTSLLDQHMSRKRLGRGSVWQFIIMSWSSENLQSSTRRWVGARLTALFQASQTVDRTIIWSNGMLACFITVQEKNRHEFWEVICNEDPK